MYRKTAVILAGGKGTRLYPYTIAMPKPLVPIGDKPILDIILRQLVRQGIDNIYLAVNHQAELIQAYCGNGDKYGGSITYILEDKPLGTMGPLKKIEGLPEDFFVLNGDVLSDIDYNSLMRYHKESGNIFTISSYKRVQHVDYGVLETEENKLTGFEEKPKLHYDVSMGIYVVSRKVLEYIPQDAYYGFDQLMLLLLSKKLAVGVKEHSGYWLDIGRPDDYQQATEDYEKGKFTC